MMEDDAIMLPPSCDCFACIACHSLCQKHFLFLQHFACLGNQSPELELKGGSRVSFLVNLRSKAEFRRDLSRDPRLLLLKKKDCDCSPRGLESLTALLLLQQQQLFSFEGLSGRDKTCPQESSGFYPSIDVFSFRRLATRDPLCSAQSADTRRESLIPFD